MKGNTMRSDAMRKFRKTTALLTAAAMCASMTNVASVAAETINENQGTASQAVRGTYVEGTAVTVYRVDIVWDSLDFTYKAGESRIWDPDTHTYTTDSSTGWFNANGDQSSTITVTNHSNTAIDATVGFKRASDEFYQVMSVYMYNDSIWHEDKGFTSGDMYDVAAALSLADASVESEGNPDAAPSAYVEFGMYSYGLGTVPDFGTNAQIGTVTVTINEG